MSFSTIGLATKNTSLVKGFDFSFDENSSTLVLDTTPVSNIFCSLFFEKRVVEQYLTKTVGFGGWAGNDDLLESEQVGSTLWYEINQGRGSQEVFDTLEVKANDAIAWIMTDELVSEAEVVISKSDQGAIFEIKASGYPNREFTLNV
jgi:phage gp46-like protein